MSSQSDNHSSSGVVDFILLEKCFWVISLELCSSIYYVCLTTLYAMLFTSTLLVTSKCVKRHITYQRGLYIVALRQPNQENVVGNQETTDTPTSQPNTDQNQANQEDGMANGQRPRLSSIMFNAVLEYNKLSNPATVGKLTEYILMMVVGISAFIAVEDKTSNLFKICTCMVIFRNIVTSAMLVTAMINQKTLLQYIHFALVIALLTYMTLVLWSYSQILDHLGN